jgi:hypothetical protein
VIKCLKCDKEADYIIAGGSYCREHAMEYAVEGLRKLAKAPEWRRLMEKELGKEVTSIILGETTPH